MKKRPYFSFILLIIIVLQPIFRGDAYGQAVKLNIPKAADGVIYDFVQLYHGYEKRLPWHTDKIKHYVYRDNKGTPEWLFDGFLFLEIYGCFNGENYDYGATQPGKLAPGKSEWEHLICKNFEDTRGPDALEAVLDSLAQKGYYPPTKRKVVFSIPNPIFGTKNWGFVGDKALDFNHSEDRVSAINWYIDRIVEEWTRKNYKHIEFAGFYWIHEQVDFQNHDDIMLKKVNAILKEKGFNSYWLPHYTAKGVDQWKELGFTYAYQQPNYFFYAKSHPKAIVNTMRYTRQLDMGIMMEYDSRVIDQPDLYKQLFYNYIEAFKEGKVWDNQPVNYYEGGDGWLRLATSKDPEAQKMYKVLGDIIVKRGIQFYGSSQKGKE